MNKFIAWAGLVVLPTIAWWLNTKWPNAENVIAISAALIGIAPAIYIEFSRRANEENEKLLYNEKTIKGLCIYISQLNEILKEQKKQWDTLPRQNFCITPATENDLLVNEILNKSLGVVEEDIFQLASINIYNFRQIQTSFKLIKEMDSFFAQTLKDTSNEERELKVSAYWEDEGMKKFFTKVEGDLIQVLDDFQNLLKKISDSNNLTKKIDDSKVKE